MTHKKIAMVGMWGVGKTSLVQQYVHSLYDEKYHATLGVKVDKKQITLDGKDITLMLWDIAGAEDEFRIPLHYIQGAAGYLLIMDGTRLASLECALDIVEQIEAGIEALPFVAVINKSDLDWEMTPDQISTHLESMGCKVFKSSAKTGENVEAAFLALANAL